MRELLLNLVDPPPFTSTCYSVGQIPRMYGIRLQGAIIKGEIDLSDCSGPEGTPLSAFILEYCIIRDGKLIKCNISLKKDLLKKRKIRRAINARSARINRLSLEGCHVVGRIDLTDATLGGDLELSDLKPLNAGCYFQVSLRRCRIDGSVIAQRTRLKIPDGQCTEFSLPDYALNLVSAEIHGSVWLQPNFYACGGVSVRGAHITGNIWAEGAKLSASNEIAFRAEQLQCDGAVSLRGNKETRVHCEITGTLSFLGAKISYLDLHGIHVVLKRSTADQEPSVDLSLARVRDNCDLGTVFERKEPADEAAVEAIVEGHIEAQGMVVGGNFDLTGLRINSLKNSKNPGIRACNLKVGGDLILDHFSSSIDLSSSHVERNLKVTNSTVAAPRNSEYGLQAYNLTVDNDVDLEGVSGTVDFGIIAHWRGVDYTCYQLARLACKGG